MPRRLEDVKGAYRRLQAYLVHEQSAAADRDDEPDFELFLSDERMLAAGFVVLIFGCIEDTANRYLEERDSRFDPRVMRRTFKEKVDHVCNAGFYLARKLKPIEDMRDEIAHGRDIATDYDIPAIVNASEEVIQELETAQHAWRSRQSVPPGT